MVHPPHGPFRIGANRQITIPAELLKRIDLAPGDSVYVAMADDVDGALVVIPVEKLVGWLDAGRRQTEIDSAARAGEMGPPPEREPERTE